MEKFILLDNKQHIAIFVSIVKLICRYANYTDVMVELLVNNKELNLILHTPTYCLTSVGLLALIEVSLPSPSQNVCVSMRINALKILVQQMTGAHELAIVDDRLVSTSDTSVFAFKLYDFDATRPGDFSGEMVVTRATIKKNIMTEVTKQLFRENTRSSDAFVVIDKNGVGKLLRTFKDDGESVYKLVTVDRQQGCVVETDRQFVMRVDFIVEICKCADDEVIEFVVYEHSNMQFDGSLEVTHTVAISSRYFRLIHNVELFNSDFPIATFGKHN